MKDMNDLHRAGVNIREMADRAELYKPKANGKADNSACFELVCLAGVTPIPVDWLWEDRLARGHLTPSRAIQAWASRRLRLIWRHA
jgi:hypothetical protein